VTPSTRRLPHRLLIAAVVVLFAAGPGFGQVLRVVSWNTANDVLDATGADSHSPTAGGPADGVFRAVGALKLAGSAHPIDVLALQESAYSTASPNPTAQAYATVLNSIYGPGTYAVAPLLCTTTGPNPGNGSNTLIYRTTTLNLVSQQALGTPSGSGVARQVMEYKFQPAGGPSSAAFYLFNDHFKSGNTTSDDDRRGVEAGVITTAVNGLPANTPVVFAGDYNPFNNTSDQGYHGVVTGSATNHGVDPLNPTNATQNWSTSANKSLDTESPATSTAFTGQGTGGMQHRDDFLLNSPGMLSGNGIQYVNGSFTIFGNTGTHTYGSAITSGDPTAFAAQLNGYTTSDAMTVLTDLTQAADHLPVVADYQFSPVPEPSALALAGFGVLVGIGYVRRWGVRSSSCCASHT
jgi:endonuclease/exonuclease/phosphatase family metal-dependent hydrolase